MILVLGRPDVVRWEFVVWCFRGVDRVGFGLGVILIFQDGLLFYKELVLVLCILCNLEVTYPFLLLVGMHCLECREVDVVCEERVVVFK